MGASGLPPVDPEDSGTPELPDLFAERSPHGPALRALEIRHTKRHNMVKLFLFMASLFLVLGVLLSQCAPGSSTNSNHPKNWVSEQPIAHQREPEYIPNPEDPLLQPPPLVFTEQPTSPCPSTSSVPTTPQTPDETRGGALSFHNPPGFSQAWAHRDIPYTQDHNGVARHVEKNWFSAIGVAEVSWQGGPYPGNEKAAAALFQCYATSASVYEQFGDDSSITDYRSEQMTVDGHSAWIVQATYHFPKRNLSTTSSSIVTSIVVDTPHGHGVLISDVAADYPEHVQALHEAIASLRVGP
ncbi:hypothetical protein [Devriesea agamarum]|uniref:hypothetical protein n=1 Tax=Devriesea agamarum TaxID=472569 RepID=UPI00071E5E1D|nr:hypothetical protein [Devriesea agamarum]